MNKYLLRRLKPTETLKNFLPQIINTFVEFYGEGQRHEIETKFNSIIFTSSQNPKYIINKVDAIKQDYSNELYDELCDKLRISDKSDFLKKCIGSNGTSIYNLDYSYNFNINVYKDFRDMYNSSQRDDVKYQLKKSKAVEFLKEYYPEVTVDNIEQFEDEGKFNQLSTFCDMLDEVVLKYREDMERFSVFEEYDKKCKEIQKDLEKKYLAKLIEDYKDFIPEEELKKYYESGEMKFLKD